MSLNKKNCLVFGFFLHIFVRTPSPTRTLPGTPNGYNRVIRGFRKFELFRAQLFTCPELPKQLSTIAILLALASLLTKTEL